MVTLCTLPEGWKTFIEVFGLIASIFALFFSGFAFFHPNFLICLYLSDHKPITKGKRLNISIKNGNNVNKKILEIKCEASVLKCDNDRVKTLSIHKNETIILKRDPDNYTFFTEKDWNDDITDDKGAYYNYVRVRLLASNFIGIKKYAEGYFRINEIIETADRNYVKIKDKNEIPYP